MSVELCEEGARQWARDCGIEYRAAGVDERMGAWAYLKVDAACSACSGAVPAGRLVIRHGDEVRHVACATVSDRCGLRAGETGRLDRKLRGSNGAPSPASAAKQLDKLDPRKCPRFKVTAPDAITSHDKLRPLALAAMTYAQRAQLAGGSMPAAPKAKVARPAPVVVVPPVPTVPLVAPVQPATVVDVPGELPACVAAWLERLVYGPKAKYARAWAEHTFCGAPAPADPGAEWAAKARRRMEYVLAG